MRLPRFELKQPESLSDAAELLSRYGSSAGLAAGGTDLFPRLKYRLAAPDVVVSLRKISPVQPVEDPEGYVSVDALMKLADIRRSDIVQQHAPLLVEAIHWIGSSQIRNMATLGVTSVWKPDARTSTKVMISSLWSHASNVAAISATCFPKGGSAGLCAWRTRRRH